MNLIPYTLCLCLIASAQTPPQAPDATKQYLKQAQLSQNGETVRLVANSPRPLEQAVDALQLKYGWLVSYEDPQFVSSLDVLTVATTDNRTLPKGGAFSAEFPASTQDEGKILQSVLDSYNKSDNPGRFELRTSSQGIVSIVGTEARDKGGRLSRQPAPFDLPITISARERTITETLNLICRQISEHRGVAIAIGISPTKLLDNTKVKVGGSKVAARELLLRALTSPHSRFYWRLLFDTSSKRYSLDIHAVRKS